jgi:hypothetical protein
MMVVVRPEVAPEQAEPFLRELIRQMERWLAGAPVVVSGASPWVPVWMGPFLAQWAPQYPALPPELVAQAAQLADQLERLAQLLRLAHVVAELHAEALGSSDQE